MSRHAKARRCAAISRITQLWDLDALAASRCETQSPVQTGFYGDDADLKTALGLTARSCLARGPPGGWLRSYDKRRLEAWICASPIRTLTLQGKHDIRKLLTPAMLISLIARFCALTGGALAAQRQQEAVSSAGERQEDLEPERKQGLTQDNCSMAIHLPIEEEQKKREARSTARSLAPVIIVEIGNLGQTLEQPH